jgi:hypothetical protein
MLQTVVSNNKVIFIKPSIKITKTRYATHISRLKI